MKKEPGDNKTENESPEEKIEKEETAIYYLDAFVNALADAESGEKDNGIIDLDESSNCCSDDSPMPSKGDYLKATITSLMAYIGYLNPKLRSTADTLIMRAEIYLADYEGKRKNIEEIE